MSRARAVCSRHVCQSYCIAAQFLNNGRHVITGSEDANVYIYSAE